MARTCENTAVSSRISRVPCSSSYTEVAGLRGASTWRIYVAHLGDAINDTNCAQCEAGVQMAVEPNHADRAAVPIRVSRSK